MVWKEEQDKNETVNDINILVVRTRSWKEKRTQWKKLQKIAQDAKMRQRLTNINSEIWERCEWNMMFSWKKNMESSLVNAMLVLML